ncbi:hypothetical protein B0H14DRAFT_2651486 [Mycena olivaceomarginata]|nr:hypothetical protein B0H14DRAFT_2651486 [Mycena olivaceomarginata]
MFRRWGTLWSVQEPQFRLTCGTCAEAGTISFKLLMVSKDAEAVQAEAARRTRLPGLFTKIKPSHIEQQLSTGDLVMPNEAFSPMPSKFGKLLGLLSIKDSSLAGCVLIALCGTVNT